MNRIEAKEILAKELVKLRSRSYEDLKKLIGSAEVVERLGENRIPYQIEIEAFWDHPKEATGDLRVLASIDDGGFISALLPVSTSFIVSSDGKIIGD